MRLAASMLTVLLSSTGSVGGAGSVAAVSRIRRSSAGSAGRSSPAGARRSARWPGRRRRTARNPRTTRPITTAITRALATIGAGVSGLDDRGEDVGVGDALGDDGDAPSGLGAGLRGDDAVDVLEAVVDEDAARRAVHAGDLDGDGAGARVGRRSSQDTTDRGGVHAHRAGDRELAGGQDTQVDLGVAGLRAGRPAGRASGTPCRRCTSRCGRCGTRPWSARPALARSVDGE